MIYQDVFRFLKRYLKSPSATYVWDAKDNFRLLGYLQERYSDEHISQNSMEIRQAFRDFFEPLGHLVVRYKDNIGITYKLFPYQVDIKKSVHLQKIIDIIRENRRAIEYPYHDKDDQIALLGKIRRKINVEIVETEEKVNKKELVRYAIKKALGLDDRDVILQQKKKYIIKLFGHNNFVSSINTVSQNPSTVYSEEDIEAYYKELFNEIEIEDFLDDVMTSLFVDDLNFEKISNAYYEKNVLSLIKQRMVEALQKYISDNNEYLQSVAGYIMKKHIVGIHERIAIEIFELISNKNKNAQEFLNYYSGQVYVENGIRYIIPEISTEDGKRWNINSLTSIASVWLRTRSNVKKLQVKLENIKQANANIEPLYFSSKQQLEENINRYEMMKQQHESLQIKVRRAEASLKSEFKGQMDRKKETDLTSAIRHDSILLQQYLRQLRDYKELVVKSEISFKAYETKYLDYQRDRKLLQQQVDRLKNELTINSDSFHSILSSVVKALMKRKKKIN